MARKEDQALIDSLDYAIDCMNVETPNWRTELYIKRNIASDDEHITIREIVSDVWQDAEMTVYDHLRMRQTGIVGKSRCGIVDVLHRTASCTGGYSEPPER